MANTILPFYAMFLYQTNEKLSVFFFVFSSRNLLKNVEFMN